jgi:hypothetical protein
MRKEDMNGREKIEKRESAGTKENQRVKGQTAGLLTTKILRKW